METTRIRGEGNCIPTAHSLTGISNGRLLKTKKKENRESKGWCATELKLNFMADVVCVPDWGVL